MFFWLPRKAMPVQSFGFQPDGEEARKWRYPVHILTLECQHCTMATKHTWHLAHWNWVSFTDRSSTTMVVGSSHACGQSLCGYPVKRLPTKSPPVCFNIKQDTRFKYYARTASFCTHVKSSYANIPASFCAILSENLIFTNEKVIFLRFFYWFFLLLF